MTTNYISMLLVTLIQIVMIITIFLKGSDEN